MASILKPHEIRHSGTLTIKLRRDGPGDALPGILRAWPVYPGGTSSGTNLLRGLTVTDIEEAKALLLERMSKRADAIAFLMLADGGMPQNLPANPKGRLFVQRDDGWTAGRNRGRR